MNDPEAKPNPESAQTSAGVTRRPDSRMIDWTAKEEILDNETRRRVYEAVVMTPGIHLRRLQRALDVPLSTLEYHLRQLERGGVVAARNVGVYKAFFPPWVTDPKDQRWLHLLHRVTMRRLIRALIDEPESTVQALERVVPVKPATISYHLKELAAAGLVQPFWYAGKKFFILEDEARVRRLISQNPLLDFEALDARIEEDDEAPAEVAP